MPGIYGWAVSLSGLLLRLLTCIAEPSQPQETLCRVPWQVDLGYPCHPCLSPQRYGAGNSHAL